MFDVIFEMLKDNDADGAGVGVATGFDACLARVVIGGERFSSPMHAACCCETLAKPFVSRARSAAEVKSHPQARVRGTGHGLPRVRAWGVGWWGWWGVWWMMS